ncbi:MAG: hypothetical protein ACKO04_00845, partial [Actinomycetes bacterium]
MRTTPRPSLLWRLFVTVGVVTMSALTFSDPAWEKWRATVGERPSRDQVRQLLVGTAGIHLAEAAVTYGRAKRAGMDGAGGWALSNFL